MRTWTICLIGAGFLAFVGLGCRTVDGPTPAEELVPADSALDLQAYDGSMPPKAGSTSVLVLGTPHIGLRDREYTRREIDHVTTALSAYDPDMLVVEQLPPEHPRGKGTDYRPALNLDSLSQAWGYSSGKADSIRQAFRRGSGEPERPCRLAKVHLLNYDLANAHYYASSVRHTNTDTGSDGCTDLRQIESLQQYFEALSQGEAGRVGYPVAQANGIRRLVPFDYRGADAQWFIQHSLLDAVKSGKVWALWHFWPVVPNVGSTYQEDRAHRAGHQDCYADELRFYNSPEWIALQYWSYEKKIQGIDWEGRSLGEGQVENYWRRNRKMFKRMQEAVEAQDPERVLVIVGSGHKYFLDELTRADGHRWIDPREHLPRSCTASGAGTSGG